MNAIEALEFLQIESTITKDDLTKVYHKLALKYHPDMGGTADLFIKLQQSYNYLKDMVPFNTLKQSPGSFNNNKNQTTFMDFSKAFEDLARNFHSFSQYQKASSAFYDDLMRKFANEDLAKKFNNNQKTKDTHTGWLRSAKGNLWRKYHETTYIIYHDRQNDYYKFILIIDEKRIYDRHTFNTEDEAIQYIESMQK